MKMLMGAVVLGFLAGCTTPSGLMSGEPEVSAVTNKSPKDFALCVYPAWQDYRSSSVMSETSSGYRVVAGNDFNGQTDDVLDISKIKSGSAVKLYQRMAWQQLGRGDLKSSLNKCL